MSISDPVVSGVIPDPSSLHLLFSSLTHLPVFGVWNRGVSGDERPMLRSSRRTSCRTHCGVGCHTPRLQNRERFEFGEILRDGTLSGLKLGQFSNGSLLDSFSSTLKINSLQGPKDRNRTFKPALPNQIFGDSLSGLGGHPFQH